MTLPNSFLTRPIAHRALHGEGRAENSVEAILAACDAGYGIEIDLQLSKDGQAIVFHDYDMTRLTGTKGPIQQRTAAEITAMPLLSGGTIPTLEQALTEVAGRAPLLIEIKDQDGRLGPNIGTLEAATAKALKGYNGDVAFMSFNPHAALAMKPTGRPIGLTTCAFTAEEWHIIPAATRAELSTLPHIDQVDFISHYHGDLTSPHLAKAKGKPLLCWTIRSSEEETKAREIADNITFENYAP